MALIICLQLPLGAASGSAVTVPAKHAAKPTAFGALKTIHMEMAPLVECESVQVSRTVSEEDPTFDFDARFRQAAIMRDVRMSGGPDVELAAKLTVAANVGDCEPAKHN